MDLQSPLCLGPFLMDSEGRLTPRTPGAPPAFVVRWRGRTVRAQVVRAEGQNGKLALQTVLGRSPSSAAAGEKRPQSFELLRVLLRPDALKPWTLRLLPDHRAMLEAETEIALPITAVGLVGEVTAFLLETTPYLDLLDEVGLCAVAG